MKSKRTLPVGSFSTGRPRSARPPRRTRPAVAASDQIPIEVQYVFERGTAAALARSWQGIEVRTQNRSYMLDASGKCVAVIDAATASEQAHPLLGSQLVGGQMRDAGGHIIEISQPFPKLGASALFATNVGERVSFSETSPVTRVVIRQRVVEIDAQQADVDWGDETRSFDRPRGDAT